MSQTHCVVKATIRINIQIVKWMALLAFLPRNKFTSEVLSVGYL